MRRVALICLLIGIVVSAFILGARDNDDFRRRARKFDRNRQNQEDPADRELSEEELKKMQSELKELLKLRKIYTKKLRSFEKKYGWKPEFKSDQQRGGQMGPPHGGGGRSGGGFDRFRRGKDRDNDDEKGLPGRDD